MGALSENKINVRKKVNSLAEFRPDLKRFYKSENNDGINFNGWSKGSHKKLRMQCDICNYIQTDKEMTSANKYTIVKPSGNFHASYSCTRCNSLMVRFPKVAAEWDYEKNEQTPWDISYGANKKFWWKCQQTHEWECTVASRTYGSNCPQCYKESIKSHAEAVLRQAVEELLANNAVYFKVEETVKGENCFSNDIVLVGSSGKRIVFEYQGSYFHYSDIALKENEDGSKYHSDNIKFEFNRLEGTSVILLDEHDFGGITPTVEMMKKSIIHAVRYLIGRNFAKSADISYNRYKNSFAQQTGQGFYAYYWNQKYEQKLKSQLSANMKRYILNQAEWNVF